MDVVDFLLCPSDLHGSSVGEASARQICHCPPASKDVRQGVPGTPGLRVSLTWLRSSDLSRRAVLKLGPVGESVSNRSAMVGHLFRSGGAGFLFPLPSFDSPPERYMEPNDDKPPDPEGRPGGYGVEVPAVIR